MQLELLESLFSYPGSFGKISPACRGYSPQTRIIDSNLICDRNERNIIGADANPRAEPFGRTAEYLCDSMN
jgi:hypothetical protein